MVERRLVNILLLTKTLIKISHTYLQKIKSIAIGMEFSKLNIFYKICAK